MSEQYRELTVENNVIVDAYGSFFGQNEVIHGSKHHLQCNSFITKDTCINFKEDFVGRNGNVQGTVPHYPWSTRGSDSSPSSDSTIMSGSNVSQSLLRGGVWGLFAGSSHPRQMNLFAGGTGQKITGTMTAALTLQVDQRVSTPNYYTGMKITKTGGNGAAGSHNIDSYNESTGVITSYTFTGTKPGTTYSIGDEDEITTGGGSFQLRKNKDLIFKARFNVAHTTFDSAFFIGLSSNTAKDLILDDCTSYKAITSNIDHTKKLSMYGFLASVNGTAKDIKCVAHNNNTPSVHTGDPPKDPTGASPILTEGKWYTCTMLITHDNVGGTGADFQVKYTLEQEATTTGELNKKYNYSINKQDNRCVVSNQTPMAPAISGKRGAGGATGQHIVYIDYIECHQIR